MSKLVIFSFSNHLQTPISIYLLFSELEQLGVQEEEEEKLARERGPDRKFEHPSFRSIGTLEDITSTLLSMGASQQHATTNTGDFTNSPRCAASMTRRPHSFKRGATEAVLQVGNGVNSPRETPSPCLSPSSQVSSPEFGIDTKKHQHQQQQHGQNLTFRVRFGAIKFLGKKNAGFDLGIVRERKRLGNFMFVCFCGFFLVLGLIKICATGWMSGYSNSGVTDKVSQSPPQFFFPSFDDTHYSIGLLIAMKKTSGNC